MFRLLIYFSLASLCISSSLVGEVVSLFDGRSLKGWEGDPKWWSVKNGEIHGGSTTEKIPHNYFLATEKSYRNFELKLKIKLSGDPKTGMINSGIQICSVRVPGSTEMSGYQVDAGEGWYGKLYDESRRNKVIATPIDETALNAVVKSGEWNEYKIRVEGPRIRSWINGLAALDYTEKDPNIAQDGHIGIQIHSGGIALIQAKDITLEELPDTPNPVTWDQVGRPVGKKTTLKEGNVLEAKPKTAREQLRTFQVPEGFEVELVAEENPEAGIGKFIAVHFDEKGRMWTMTALEYPVDGNENPEAAAYLYTSQGRDKIVVFDHPFEKGPHQGRIFAEGLAIPLGILPYQDGCYALHGPDLVFLHDKDQDGKADERKVILTGFGVQDSHLFPHQFTRAPGGWIWMAQGAFNYSQVRRPDDPPEKALAFDQTRMAKFRPDGSGFDITSNGPCNIWGLAMNGEGETFIQEANDGMYSVVPFHEYANYPGCSNKQWKSYAPEFPAIADFRLGGTGLSGLALTDAKGPFPAPWADVVLVANPITRVINAVKLHRNGSSWKAERLPDFLTSTDPMFRPVALTLGPDGCVYIVDWYNKIISHNEVARNHPDRDKTRGRIWRIRPTSKPSFEMNDFTKLSTSQLMEKLGATSTTQSHLAWQTLADRELSDAEIQPLHQLVLNSDETPARRIQALWILSEKNQIQSDALRVVFESQNRNLRRELTRAWAWVIAQKSPRSESDINKELAPLRSLTHDPDPEVRSELIRTCGVILDQIPEEADLLRDSVLELLLNQVKEPLNQPIGRSTWHGKPIKVGAAYEREFERYLIRLQLERHYEKVYDYLTSKAGDQISIESRLLAALSLPEPISVSLVADILPKLPRAPGGEEVLRLFNAFEQPDVHASLKKILEHPLHRDFILKSLLEVRDRMDEAKVRPLILEPTRQLFEQGAESSELATQLVSSFKIEALSDELVKLAKEQAKKSETEKALLTSLQALGQVTVKDLEFLKLLALHSPSQPVKDEAILALASQDASALETQLKEVWPQVAPTKRRLLLDRLCSHPTKVKLMLDTLEDQIADFLQISHLERMQALLPDDERVKKWVKTMESRSKTVLRLNGNDHAWVQTKLELPEAFTVESWIKLQPQKRGISNADSMLSLRGVFDINFYQGKARVYAAEAKKDIVVAKKPIMPETWTHVAVSRNQNGIWKIYIDGELSNTSQTKLLDAIQQPRIGDSFAAGGTQATFVGYRVWNREMSADEIRASFDREFPKGTPNLVFSPTSQSEWTPLSEGATLSRELDLPPLLSPEAAQKLDQQFEKYRRLAQQSGDKANGKVIASLCTTCHLIQGQGTSIGPDLSGVGAMGLEAILRNILTPNAAMESAYRVYRVSLEDGSMKEGFLAREDQDSIVLRIVGSQDERIPKSRIIHSEFLRRSLMPEGLLNPLPDQAVTDLFEYLKSLK